MKKIILSSGSTLEITIGSFVESRDLFQALMSESLPIKFNDDQDININMFKDILFTALSSKKVESALWVCLKRVLYNKEKVTESIFDNNEDARADYLEICFYVTKENVFPFTKNLYAKYYPMLQQVMKMFQA